MSARAKCRWGAAHRLGLAALAVVAAAVSVDAGDVGAQTIAPPTIEETALDLGDGTALRYGIALPAGYDASARDPRPLVVSLHPGGSGEYYGSEFMQGIVEPGLRSWRAVIVAPDVPDRSWATPRSERAILALVRQISATHAIDPARVLVTGFSMGGRGTWYMASRHSEVFTGAIVMAGSPDAAEVAGVSIPIFLIHSPSDEVVPFERAEAAYLALTERGHPVEMRVLPGAGHYTMGAYVGVLRAGGSWMLARWGAGAR